METLTSTTCPPALLRLRRLGGLSARETGHGRQDFTAETKRLQKTASAVAARKASLMPAGGIVCNINDKTHPLVTVSRLELAQVMLLAGAGDHYAKSVEWTLECNNVDSLEELDALTVKNLLRYLESS